MPFRKYKIVYIPRKAYPFSLEESSYRLQKYVEILII